ncbi:uncharacterized protein LOC119098271 [Pollicipes pollicipes]|uniref:uncharacterized protein LOC119098271 n=1 Tax=Pollicipes pollicipes TaxID=41117 RepID=UPI0018853019|nr:uncharacterized protein LOC119098271 [Pollicipes pollicipes]
MAPRTERNVNVLFTPNEVHTYRDSVVIRPSTQHRSLNSAMIPLSGYAGASDVQIQANGRDAAGRPVPEPERHGRRRLAVGRLRHRQRGPPRRLREAARVRRRRLQPPAGVAPGGRPPGPAGAEAVFEGEQPGALEGMPLGIPVSKVQEVFFANMKQTKLPLMHMEELVGGVPQSRNGAYTAAGHAIIQEHVPRQTVPLELTKRGASPAGGAAGVRPPAPRPPPVAADAGWWPQPPGVEQLVTDNGQAKLRLSTNHLMFPRTSLGVPRALALQLTNLGDDVLKWNIFGYSVPYLVTGVNAMVKCGYDVFKMRPQDGLVKPGQTAVLQVTFSPPYPGQLTQLFQMLCKPAKDMPGMPMVVYTLPVQVSGRGSVLNEGEDESDLLAAPLHVSEDYLFFRHWSICHKLEVTNKTRENMNVEYCVTGPFKVVAGPNEHSLTDHTEGTMLAPSQRYVQMSVYFCPKLAGSFSGQLRLSLKNSTWRHAVRLEGTCEDVDALLQSLLPGDP